MNVSHDLHLLVGLTSRSWSLVRPQKLHYCSHTPHAPRILPVTAESVGSLNSHQSPKPTQEKVAEPEVIPPAASSHSIPTGRRCHNGYCVPCHDGYCAPWMVTNDADDLMTWLSLGEFSGKIKSPRSLALSRSQLMRPLTSCANSKRI